MILLSIALVFVLFVVCSDRSLPSIDDQDLTVNIPEDVGGRALNYLAVWSRSSLVNLLVGFVCSNINDNQLF